MKREEKNALSQQRILEAAMEEFSRKGYEGASLSTVCTEKGSSKGIIYHYYRDKDALYLRCVQQCFDALTAELWQAAQVLAGPVEQRLRDYFDARLRFFAGHPLELGVLSMRYSGRPRSCGNRSPETSDCTWTPSICGSGRRSRMTAPWRKFCGNMKLSATDGSTCCSSA